MLIYSFLSAYPRQTIPSHLLNHKAFWIEDFLTSNTTDDLNDFMRELAHFPSNIDDLKTIGFIPRHEHVGEAQPIEEGEICSHPFLVPNIDKTLCILPQRIDIGKHFITSGGPDAIREPYEKMISRVTSFGRYMMGNLEKYPIMERLFASETFQSGAKSICPEDKQYLDPFQFNFIMQVPGQTVATHIDGAYFWGATRKEIPQWLLACMVFSGLFQDRFIDQVQVVAYLHKWAPEETTGGVFVHYNTASDEPERMVPLPRSAALIDGSKTIHAALVYRPDVAAPTLDKNQQNELRYVGDETWHLMVGEKVSRVFSTDELRMSIVYRARCFSSEEDRDRFYNLPDEHILPLEDILAELQAALVRRGKYTAQALHAMPRLDLALTLIDSYIAYPLPSAGTALIPFNYCFLGKMWPGVLDRLLHYVCE